ncbi:MAG: transposase [Anaerolineae bacterium]
MKAAPYNPALLLSMLLLSYLYDLLERQTEQAVNENILIGLSSRSSIGYNPPFGLFKGIVPNGH